MRRALRFLVGGLVFECVLTCCETDSDLKSNAGHSVWNQGYYADLVLGGKTVEELKAAANAGDVNSAVRLDGYYFEVMQDGENGRKWRIKAAELGDANAQFSEGSMLYDYAKNKKERTEGIKWLRRAAAQGQPNAIEKIAKEKL